MKFTGASPLHLMLPRCGFVLDGIAPSLPSAVAADSVHHCSFGSPLSTVQWLECWAHSVRLARVEVGPFPVMGGAPMDSATLTWDSLRACILGSERGTSWLALTRGGAPLVVARIGVAMTLSVSALVPCTAFSALSSLLADSLTVRAAFFCLVLRPF